MNTLPDATLERIATDEPSFESALAAFGWEPVGPACWRLGTGLGDALLVEVSHRDQWRQFELSAGAVPRPTSNRALQNNAGLFGPAKLVDRPGDCPVCRLDVPEDLTGSLQAPLALGVDEIDAHLAWGRAVTALATGELPQEYATPIFDAVTIVELKQAGWSASVDEGQAIIHLQLPGVYRRLTLARDKRAGVTLAGDLIELADLKGDCLRAMLLLAQEANARLPLVRMVVAESPHRITLRAEVSFGDSLITGSFLLHSLHVLEAAVGLTAREFETLRDAELAQMVLSTAAMRNSVAHD